MRPSNDANRFSIRQLGGNDIEQCLALWREYCQRSKVEVPESVTQRTWERLVNQSDAMGCLVAEHPALGLVGFCTYVLHPNTFSVRSCCYMEDLYVAEKARRRGVGTALTESLIERGRELGWCRVYRITEGDNSIAQAMYDRIGKRTGHVRYKVAISENTREQ